MEAGRRTKCSGRLSLTSPSSPSSPPSRLPRQRHFRQHATNTPATEVFDGRDGDCNDRVDVIAKDVLLVRFERVKRALRHREHGFAAGAFELENVARERLHLLHGHVDHGVTSALQRVQDPGTFLFTNRCTTYD